MKTLILSCQDEHVRQVVAEFERLGHSWVLFDPGAYPASVIVSTVFDGGKRTTRFFSADGVGFCLEDVGSVWYRRPSPIRASRDLPVLQQTFIEREARAALWSVLCAHPARWMNHPDAIRQATQKPRQLVLAQRLGLVIPPTLITNDPEAFRRFYHECKGKVIYKLMGFPSYQVEDEVTVSMYSSLVPEALLDEVERIRATAHLFQAFVEKLCDLRVVVIGEQVTAVAMYPLSDAARIDFRRDYGALRYEVHVLPDEVKGALLAFCGRYGLTYAGIDLLFTEKREYIFLECNPVGQLGWLEEPTGLPLYRMLAHFLAGKQ